MSSSPEEIPFSFSALKARFEQQQSPPSAVVASPPPSRSQSPGAEKPKRIIELDDTSTAGWSPSIRVDDKKKVVETNQNQGMSGSASTSKGSGITDQQEDNRSRAVRTEDRKLLTGDSINIFDSIEDPSPSVKSVDDNNALNIDLGDETTKQDGAGRLSYFTEVAAAPALSKALHRSESTPSRMITKITPPSPPVVLPRPASSLVSRPSISKPPPPPVPISRNSRSVSPMPAKIKPEVRRELPIVPPRPNPSPASPFADLSDRPIPTSRATISNLAPNPPARPPLTSGSRKGSVSCLTTPSGSPSANSAPLFTNSFSSAPIDITSSASSATLQPPPRKVALTKTPPLAPNRPESPSQLHISPVIPSRPYFAAIPPRIAPAVSQEAAASPAIPYLPPPPPGRAIASNERLAPQRPAIVDADSSDDEESTSPNGSIAGVKSSSQEFPDATFANRRPPTLRSRRLLNFNGHKSLFALRGTRLVTAHYQIQVWDSSSASSSSLGVIALGLGEQKIHNLAFKSDDIVWVGTKEGHIFEVDIVNFKINHQRAQIHPHPLAGIFKLRNTMLTLDESGKVLLWRNIATEAGADIFDSPRAQRIMTSSSSSSSTSSSSTGVDFFSAMIGNELWTATAPSSGSRNASIRVYDPTGARAFVLTPRTPVFPDPSISYGLITSGAKIPSQPDLVFLGHSNGYISTWSSETFTCLKTQRISPSSITALASGIENSLWVGFKTGYIGVYKIVGDRWTVTKMWKAHKDSVTMMMVDYASLDEDDSLPIASIGGGESMMIWDGLLREDWIDQELVLRQADYCTFRPIKTLVISWNIDASTPSQLSGSVNNSEFLTQALTSMDGPDIIVFGFQEVIDLENKSLTARTMLFGKQKNDKLSDAVSASYRLWNDKLVAAVRMAMPPECPYTVTHVGDMVGLFSCVFVKSSQRENIHDITLVNCKTGMGGRYGNKGALLCRLVIDDTSLCFINCHLAAGQRAKLDRDRDLADIIETQAFSNLSTSSPGAYNLGGDGTAVFDHEICILSGDLNYRIDQVREAVVLNVMRKEFDKLLAQDQLLKGLVNNPSFRLRSFKEPPIRFAPTYKYDRGTNDYDSSSKKRIPAWCDRVLYRADEVSQVKPLHYSRYEVNVSDHRPISAGFEMVIKKIIPDKREAVWKEVERSRSQVEIGLIEEALEFYARY